MKRYRRDLYVSVLVVCLILIGLLANDGSYLTGDSVLKGAATVTNANREVIVNIPQHAVEVADGVFDLGQATVDGEKVQGFMFIDYKTGFAKPPWAGGNKKSSGTCFEFLSKGAKWKTAEPYVLNPTNSDGMTDDFVRTNIATSLGSWNSKVDADVFGCHFQWGIRTVAAKPIAGRNEDSY